jgi:hypothetical protein
MGARLTCGASRQAASRRARSAFFVRIGGVARTARAKRCDHTLPLFPLWLILDADGTLPGSLRELVRRTKA